MRNRYIASFDTEDDGKGNPYLWAIVHEKGAWYGHTRDAALEFILTLARDLAVTNTTLELWATNLEYDLVNLFGAARLRELSLRFGKSYLVGATWPNHNVTFRDTVRHIPLSVRELGELVGVPKLIRKKGIKGNEAYCVRDATITRRTAKWLDTLYRQFEIMPKQTLASSALSIWRQNYWKREIRLPSLEIVSNAKAAYYGGRTEAFSIGLWENIRVLDVASMFPWAMVGGTFPVPWGPFRRKGNTKQILPNGVYEAQISASIEYPLLPYRTPKGLVYATGKFNGWYMGLELQGAVSAGYDVEILRGYEFIDECKPFIQYVNDFYNLKSKARGPARLGYKLLLNALYGKFGQTGEKVVAIPLEKFVTMYNPPEKYRYWNGIVIYSMTTNPPPWGNNIWSAIITARARVRLWQEMQRIRAAGGIVLYCDTDSIIYQGADSLKYPQKAAKLGDFELRGEYAKILIAGKKEYGLWDYKGQCSIHVKGIPEKARLEYLTNGRAEFSRPSRLREAARKGTAANIWNVKEKVRRVNFDKRGRKPDGTFIPIHISGE